MTVMGEKLTSKNTFLHITDEDIDDDEEQLRDQTMSLPNPQLRRLITEQQ